MQLTMSENPAHPKQNFFLFEPSARESQRAGATEYVTNYERNFDIPKQKIFLFEP